MVKIHECIEEYESFIDQIFQKEQKINYQEIQRILTAFPLVILIKVIKRSLLFLNKY